MSSDIKSARELTNDPYGKLLNALAKKFSAFVAKDQAELVENPEDIFANAQDVDSVLKWHNFAMTKKFTLAVDYQSASEPDLDKMKLWLGVVWPNLGNQLPDKSGFLNHATLNGDPTLIDGAPFDLGIVDGASNTKSIAMRFNRPTSPLVNTESLTISDNSSLQVSGIATGMSYFIRFRVKDLAQQGGINRTLFEKIDDSTPNNGAMLHLSTDGRLAFYVKRAGTEYNAQTAAGTIVADTVYEVWLTYAVSGNVIHIYVNNVDKSLTGATAANWHATLTNHDLSIFRRGLGSDGYVYGDFYGFELLREKVVSSTEVGRHFTNKWTLANIPFGQVMISNYFATKYDALALTRVSLTRIYKFDVAGAPVLTRVSKSLTCKYDIVVLTPSATSFTSTSFTSTSFTT